MVQPRNPAELVGLGRDPMMARLLRACGTQEACVTGRASDYDQFLALASAMPLCEGHPIRDQVHAALREATGLTADLCPHTARAFWDAWTELYWLGRDRASKPLHGPCPFCEPVRPKVWTEAELDRLPSPLDVVPRDAEGWTEQVQEVFLKQSGPIVCTLPEDYTFIRPDPYHVREVLRLLSDGATVTPGQRDLLFVQALRIGGQVACKRGEAGRLFLRGGHGEEVTRLLDYLQKSKALAPLIWFPREPEEAETVMGLYNGVEVGLDLSLCMTPEERQDRIARYATRAPLGRAVVLA